VAFRSALLARPWRAMEGARASGHSDAPVESTSGSVSDYAYRSWLARRGRLLILYNYLRAEPTLA
jgi:hypothetical protein